MRKLFFVESLHHHPGRNKKKLQTGQYGQYSLPKTTMPVCLFWKQMVYGGEEPGSASLKPTNLDPARFGAAVAAHIWLKKQLYLAVNPCIL